MKKILICILCFVAARGFGQFRLGIEGGATVANFWQTDGFGGLGTGLSSWPVGGYHAGLVGELDLGSSGLVFQPAVLYYTNGSHLYNSVGFIDNTNVTITATNTNLKIASLRVPLNFAYKFAINNRVKVLGGLGPYFAKTLSSTEKGTYTGNIANADGTFTFVSGSIDNKAQLSSGYSYASTGVTKVNPYDIGGDVFIGAEYKKFQLTINYSRGFTRMYRTTYANTGNFAWNFTLAYLIFGHDRKPDL
jgi:Outer membrane protein beta-barrel domain